MFGFKLFWIVFVDIGIIENDIIVFYQQDFKEMYYG